MSNLKVNTINDASGGSNAQLYGVASPPNSMGFRNRIINGDMRIDQRNAGASAVLTNGGFCLDRWKTTFSQTSKYTVQQNAGSVTPPAGFTNYLGVTSSSAYSILTGDFFMISQPIEGFNVADLGWGASGAQTVTLSFWVRSSLTGTFGGALLNGAETRSYPFSYTISAANTWEQKTLTIAGDTTGTWLTNNGVGMKVMLGLGVGSTYSGTAGSWSGSTFYSATGATSVVGTNGATFYITGVQLEAGSVASPFERRDYGRELMMCQRYYVKLGGFSGGHPRILQNAYATSAYVGASFGLPVIMRATPTAALIGSWTNQNTNVGDNAFIASPDGIVFYTTASAAGLIAGLFPTNSTGFFTASAEL